MRSPCAWMLLFIREASLPSPTRRKKILSDFPQTHGEAHDIVYVLRHADVASVKEHHFAVKPHSRPVAFLRQFDALLRRPGLNKTSRWYPPRAASLLKIPEIAGRFHTDDVGSLYC